jgi:hypothetical protein
VLILAGILEVDFVANWPKTGPIFSQDLYERCCNLVEQDGMVSTQVVNTLSLVNINNIIFV